MLVDERNIKRGNFSLLFGTPEAIVESERWRELLLGDQQDVAVAKFIYGKKDRYIISYKYHVTNRSPKI